MAKGLAVTIIAATAVAFAASASAQAGGSLTLQQMEQRYPRMSRVHIEKCDHGGDGLFDRGEQACVASIYSVMYLDH